MATGAVYVCTGVLLFCLFRSSDDAAAAANATALTPACALRDSSNNVVDADD